MTNIKINDETFGAMEFKVRPGGGYVWYRYHPNGEWQQVFGTMGVGNALSANGDTLDSVARRWLGSRKVTPVKSAS